MLNLFEVAGLTESLNDSGLGYERGEKSRNEPKTQETKIKAGKIPPTLFRNKHGLV